MIFKYYFFGGRGLFNISYYHYEMEVKSKRRGGGDIHLSPSSRVFSTVGIIPSYIVLWSVHIIGTITILKKEWKQKSILISFVTFNSPYSIYDLYGKHNQLNKLKLRIGIFNYSLHVCLIYLIIKIVAQKLCIQVFTYSSLTIINSVSK